MYHDLIRSELNEAADTLANFLKDDSNIDAIHGPRYCWLTLSRRVAKYCHVVMGVPL